MVVLLEDEVVGTAAGVVSTMVEGVVGTVVVAVAVVGCGSTAMRSLHSIACVPIAITC